MDILGTMFSNIELFKTFNISKKIETGKTISKFTELSKIEYKENNCMIIGQYGKYN